MRLRVEKLATKKLVLGIPNYVLSGFKAVRCVLRFPVVVFTIMIPLRLICAKARNYPADFSEDRTTLNTAEPYIELTITVINYCHEICARRFPAQSKSIFGFKTVHARTKYIQI